MRGGVRGGRGWRRRGRDKEGDREGGGGGDYNHYSLLPRLPCTLILFPMLGTTRTDTRARMLMYSAGLSRITSLRERRSK